MEFWKNIRILESWKIISRMEFQKINFKNWNFEKLNFENGILEN